MYENQEKEICDLKTDILTLKEENKQLKYLVDSVTENMRENIKLIVSEEITKQNTVNPNKEVVEKSYQKYINKISENNRICRIGMYSNCVQVKSGYLTRYEKPGQLLFIHFILLCYKDK